MTDGSARWAFDPNATWSLAMPRVIDGHRNVGVHEAAWSVVDNPQKTDTLRVYAGAPQPSTARRSRTAIRRRWRADR